MRPFVVGFAAVVLGGCAQTGGGRDSRPTPVVREGPRLSDRMREQEKEKAKAEMAATQIRGNVIY